MKKQILLLTLSLLALLPASAQRKVMEHPDYVFNTNPDVEIQRVEFLDTATVVVVDYKSMSQRNNITDISCLDDENGRTYSLKAVKFGSSDGSIDSLKVGDEISLVYEPMPETVKVFDLRPVVPHNNHNARWCCYGIRDKGTKVSTPHKNLAAAEKRMMKSMPGSGLATIRGRFIPESEEIARDLYRPIGNLKLSELVNHPFVINPDSTFSFSIELPSPTKAWIELGNPINFCIPVYLVPGKEVYLELEHPLEHGARLTFADSNPCVQYSRHVPIQWEYLLPNRYKQDLKSLFVDSQDYIDSLSLLADYLIHKHKMTDEEAILTRSEIMHGVYNTQLQYAFDMVRMARKMTAADAFDTLYNHILPTAGPRVKKHVETVLSDATYILGSSQDYFCTRLQRLLPYDHASLSGGPEKFIEGYCSEIEGMLRPILHFKQTPQLLQYAMAAALGQRFNNWQSEQDAQAAIAAFCKKYSNPALACIMENWMQGVQTRPVDPAKLPGNELLQQITAKHRGKNVILLPLMTKFKTGNRTRNNTLHYRLDNLIHDFRDNPDFAFVFVVSQEYATQQQFDHMRQFYLPGYPDVHYITATDYYKLALMNNRKPYGDFGVLLLDRNGNILPDYKINVDELGDEAEYNIRRGIRLLLEEEKQQGNK